MNTDLRNEAAMPPLGRDESYAIEVKPPTPGVNPDAQVVVYKYGVYPRHSVLAGQTSKFAVEFFDTVEEARAAFPSAEERGYVRPEMLASVPSHPPADFDPLDAGEVWSEDDY